MREISLLKKFYFAYRLLNLSRRKMIVVIGLMFVTSILEMSGLSILYPLVLSLGGSDVASPISIPFSLPVSLSP